MYTTVASLLMTEQSNLPADVLFCDVNSNMAVSRTYYTDADVHALATLWIVMIVVSLLITIGCIVGCVVCVFCTATTTTALTSTGRAYHGAVIYQANPTPAVYSVYGTSQQQQQQFGMIPMDTMSMQPGSYTGAMTVGQPVAPPKYAQLSTNPLDSLNVPSTNAQTSSPAYTPFANNTSYNGESSKF